jgi:prevent-host-death family protein
MLGQRSLSRYVDISLRCCYTYSRYVATFESGGYMTITTVTSREFNQDVSRIKRAAVNGPVFITDRGQPAHVLLSIEDYQKLTEIKESIIDLLAMPDVADIDFEPAKLNKDIFRPEDFD